MPYISEERRAELLRATLPTRDAINAACTPGDLNYLISMTVLGYIEARGKNYTHINDAIGVLEAVKLELYRRLAAPYENQKARQNGDLPYGYQVPVSVFSVNVLEQWL